MFGGVVLNYPVGGLNEYAVLETARQGGRVVRMPTINARHFIENSAEAPMLAKAIPPGVSGLTATKNGRLFAAGRVLDAIAGHGLTLATATCIPMSPCWSPPRPPGGGSGGSSSRIRTSPSSACPRLSPRNWRTRARSSR